MNCFTETAKTVPEFRSLVTAIHKKRLPAGVTGVSYIHKAHAISSLCVGFKRHAIVIAPDEVSASRLADDMSALGVRAYLFPARDFSYHTEETVSREYEHTRLRVLDRMLTGNYDAVVLSAESALQLTIPPEKLRDNSIIIKSGENYDMTELSSSFIAAGYSSAYQIDGPGQFAIRGGILDFFPPDATEPCRVEFWGDTVDSVFSFDLDSQRRTELLDEVRITPAKEVLISDEELAELIDKLIADKRIRGEGLKMLRGETEKIRGGIKVSCADKFLPIIYPESCGIFDYAGDAMLFVCESFAVKDKMNTFCNSQRTSVASMIKSGVLSRGLERYTLEDHEIYKLYNSMGAVYLDSLPRGSFDTGVKELISFTAKQITPWNGSLAAIKEDIGGRMVKSGYTCVVMAGTEKAAANLAEALTEEGVRCTHFPTLPEKFPKGTVSVIAGSVSYGFEYPGADFTLFSYRARAVQKQAPRRKSSKNAFNNLSELTRGEYVVHSAHGIGVFEGITSLETSGTVRDYIKIRYDKGDILYVPVTQLDQVSKYIGGYAEGRAVKLNKLGGSDWQKTRSRVRSAVQDMAKELIELYSKRLKMPGYPFSPDIDMQADFESKFEFAETEDQLRCIKEIKRDMEKPYPMDRLLCGDVGFGKTEVALRAVFKAVADGKQAAILVPTTILALQHYQTILKRFEGFPVEIRMLSRFCTKSDIDKTVVELKKGSVDIVVGTHRLISNDVRFRDLGLIIIDEEQRFGVAQKEKLKALYPKVDVLTLTATPIPRTLNMAMSGIRDMSVLEEAPLDRRPVQTYVIEYNEGVLVQAMEQELRRGGQVYYLYNKVETIERKANEIMKLIPDASVAIAHGKMSEDELSEVWRRLLEGEIDILVCTTIIETGIDVPNVNTLIIEDADRMGLAQLHQIRGRVGRSARRASAYFTFRIGKQLSEIAEKRLDAIREFTEFGSGFHIAMRDLELRGAGNVLGTGQHGHMEAVGYDMYIKLLEQAINEQKGVEPDEPEKDCLIDLPVDANIPQNYIPNTPQRLQIYRRIADIRTREDSLDVTDELIDRFGDPPESVKSLIRISSLRVRAARCDITEIILEGSRIIFNISDFDREAVNRAASVYPGRFFVSPGGGKPYFYLKLDDTSPLKALKSAENIVTALEGKGKTG